MHGLILFTYADVSCPSVRLPGCALERRSEGFKQPRGCRRLGGVAVQGADGMSGKNATDLGGRVRRGGHVTMVNIGSPI